MLVVVDLILFGVTLLATTNPLANPVFGKKLLEVVFWLMECNPHLPYKHLVVQRIALLQQSAPLELELLATAPAEAVTEVHQVRPVIGVRIFHLQQHPSSQL